MDAAFANFTQPDAYGRDIPADPIDLIAGAISFGTSGVFVLRRIMGRACRAWWQPTSESVAIGGFGAALEASGDLTAIKDSLRGTTAGLSTAFETTFVALVGTLFIQLHMTHLQHEEAKFLDECSDYCHANLVSKLRLSD